MGKLAEYLRNYFENTPKEKLEADWKRLEYLNDVGMSVDEYVKRVKAYHKYSIEQRKKINRLMVADIIKDALKEKGMKQKDLANQLGVKSAAVSLLLHGKRNISIDKLSEIECLLDIELFSNGYRGEEGVL